MFMKMCWNHLGEARGLPREDVGIGSDCTCALVLLPPLLCPLRTGGAGS